MLPVSEAAADADVRFVHAVPGAPAASLTVGGASLPAVGFGSATGYTAVDSGDVTLRLGSDGDTIADSADTLADGSRYTVVAAGTTRSPDLTVYRDGRPAGGQARIRAIGAASELGDVDVDLGGETIASNLGFGAASDYASVDPGSYSLEATRPGGGGSAIVSQPGAVVAAGSSTTAVLLGSGGERTRFLVLNDSTVTPAGAPATGLGGLTGEQGAPWLLALMAALLAGAVGGGAHRFSGRRRAG
ncbi:MAG: DUF4397 domain-containing protein [Thermoleophilaceae bacterium]|nr:DUF4397 domain-containing protein [Thermoleophilaceae bacterium]